MVSKNRPYIHAVTLSKGDLVECPKRGRGRVETSARTGGCWVRFDSGEYVLFTYRTNLQAWRAFPGPASGPSLILA